MENCDDRDNEELQDPHAASAQAFSSFKYRHRTQFSYADSINDPDHQLFDTKQSRHTEIQPVGSIGQLLKTDDTSPSKLFSDPQSYDPSSNTLDIESVIHHFENAGRNRSPVVPQAPEFPSRFTFYTEKTGIIRSSSFNHFDLKVDGTGNIRESLTSDPFWIDVSSPTASEMNEISRLFGLHPLTNEDIQTPDTREKCEVFSKYFFVVIRLFLHLIRTFDPDQYRATFLQPISYYIVIFEECILSFYYGQNSHSKNVRARIDQLRQYGLHVTTEWINYALIDDITDSFLPVNKITELEVDAIEELVLILLHENEQSDMIRRMGIVRKQVMQIMRLMSTKADVIKTIINRCINNSGETKFYLEDIHDHILTMMQNLNHYEKSLARSHSNYLAQISIDITQASNRTSDTVMRMTLLASILVPLNIITGLWGMNVRVPGQELDSLFWFYAILLSMIFLIIATFCIIRKASIL